MREMRITFTEREFSELKAFKKKQMIRSWREAVLFLLRVHNSQKGGQK